MAYTPPIREMRFALQQTAGLDQVLKLDGYDHVSDDLVEAVLEEAGKLSSQVWAPVNQPGDLQGATLESGAVTTADGYKDAYKQYADGGWNSLTSAEDYGGQNLPHCLSMAVTEMWQSANLALSLCPLLSQAAIEAIHQYGDEAQKKTYLPKLVSGEWTGTMNLTEPQAGTDLAAIRTVATKNGDHYLMKGQKIFITFGEHDFTDNIIHLVLARIDGLPEGNDGLGLFIVPKFLVKENGSIGERNDLQAVSLEHKLGIHGSPTCVMSYGDNEGAVAYLVGEEGAGLKNMFTMMNNARIAVGLQGVALSERAYQRAVDYARERVQSAKIGDKTAKRVPIIEHADIRRMLMTMKASTEASRALAYAAGAMIDHMKRNPDAEQAKLAAARVDLLTPLVKAWSTDLAVSNASLGIQVHGGMGFIEETGVAQYYRDARILPIYEGTNGIQSNDLLFRKVLRDDAKEAKRFMAEMETTIAALKQKQGDDAAVIATALEKGVEALSETTDWMIANARTNIDAVASSAVPYLEQFSVVAGGFMLAGQAVAALDGLETGDDADFMNTKLMTARFYAEALMPQVQGLRLAIMGGHTTATQMDADRF